MKNTEIHSHQNCWHKLKSSTLNRPRVTLQSKKSLQKPLHDGTEAGVVHIGGSSADLRRQLLSGQYILDQEQELEPLLLFGSGAGAENSSKPAQDPSQPEENMTLNQLGS